MKSSGRKPAKVLEVMIALRTPTLPTIVTIILYVYRCLEELHPVVVALRQETQSGNCPRHHIFYKVQNAIEFAQKSSDLRKQFTHHKEVTLFAETPAFHGKDKVMNLFRGAGFHGQQKGGTFNFNFGKLESSVCPI